MPLFNTFIRYRASALGIAVLLAGAPVSAEIYKWKDASGRWQFSDKAPPDKRGVATVENNTKSETSTSAPGDRYDPVVSDGTENLAARLTEKYRPDNAIGRTTLGVVGIETPLGQGSGFFITNTGYIVTNKHVIRPEMMGQLDQQKASNETTRRQINSRRVELAGIRRELDDYAAELVKFKQDIDRRSEGRTRNLELNDYENYQQQYQSRLQALKNAEAELDRVEREHDRSTGDFRFNATLAAASTSFTIYLKDDTKLSARLVEISPDHDLALLKLAGFTTPMLPPGNDEAMKQGARVFAVGSPLGMRDSVTSGIVTRRTEDYLVTDARILPGNSGGPLMNSDGEVIGVNTLKFAQTAMSEGFGMAIPLSVVRTAFGKYMPSH